MEQVNNHYHGAVTFQNSVVQSQYVPEEKPYAVYYFTWDESVTSIAQRIGTLLVGRQDEDGEVAFHAKPVYRLLSDYMVANDHCFVSGDAADIVSDEEFLGFAGDTMGLADVAKVVQHQEIIGERFLTCADIVRNMRLAGLKVELPERTVFDTVDCEIDWVLDRNVGGKVYSLRVGGQTPIRVNLCATKGEPVRGCGVISGLQSQLEDWRKIGVSLGGLKLSGKDSRYQQQIDELWQLVTIFDGYAKVGDGMRMYLLLRYRDVLGTGRCFYDDFVKAVEKVHSEEYDKADIDLQWTIDRGLATREANIIQFSAEIERMAEWQWRWKDDDRRGGE